LARIAILGATGHIGHSLAMLLAGEHELLLYARRPEAINGLAIDEFGKEPCEVVINAIGAGDPARIAALGAGIFTLTESWDNRVLAWLEKHPKALYLNMSSGAVYGSDFAEPAHDWTRNCVAVNNVSPQHYYSLAKLHAEAKHRASPQLNIVDLRVFSYFSRWIDIEGRFFLAEVIRALRDQKTFLTKPDEMIRDHLCPSDLKQLVDCVMAKWQGGPVNAALDCYTQEPVGKFATLERLTEEFGLVWRSENVDTLAPTGVKSCYYSTSRLAGEWGYAPKFTALDGLVSELREIRRV
jgi:nucleoside-diphosphate-sugar epimerase